MGVNAVYFEGNELYIPGSYSKINIDQLNQGAGVIRTPIFIGEAESGIPYNAAAFPEKERINIIGSSTQAKTFLTRGKLYDFVRFGLTPSKDAGINGPAQIVSIIVNPLTRATKTLTESAAEKIIIDSYIYGKSGNNLRISIAAGTKTGKLLKVANDEVKLYKDNVEKQVFSILYTGLAATATITISATKLITTCAATPADDLDLTFADYGNLGELVNAINAHPTGVYDAELIQDSEYNHTQLDVVTTQDIKVAYTVKENFQAIIDWFTATGLVVASIKELATRTDIDVTSGYVFLSGGTNPAADPTNWQAALDLAKKINSSYVGVASGSASIQALLNQHLIDMASVTGRDERQGCGGALLADSDSDKKTAAKSLGNRLMGYWTDSVWRYTDNAVLQEYDPFYGAAILLGMSAGNDILFSPTFKNINVEKNSKEYTQIEKNEFIKAGCIITEENPLGGIRIVRALTTNISPNPIATDWQAMGTTLHITKTHRREMEVLIGEVGVTAKDAETNSTEVLDDFTTTEKGWLIIDPAFENSYRNHIVIIEADVIKYKFEGTVPITTNFTLGTYNFTVIGVKR